MRLTQALEPYAPADPDTVAENVRPPAADPAIALAEVLARSTGWLLEAAGIPAAGDGLILSNETADGSVRIRIAIPTLSPSATGRALAWVLEAANALATVPEAAELSPEQRDALDKRVAKLREGVPQNKNRRHLIRAALSLEIPLLQLPLGTIQLGWGNKARLFRSSASELTPLIGTVLARNKLAAAAMLKLVGIPMPEHELAPTPEAAVATARRLGFPVVVKPVDLDKGAGATANLQTEDELRRAYADARASSDTVMVEQHVDGREYRLLVVQGRLFWALERVPARVIGDGISTVGQLIEAVNATRREGPSTGLSLVRIAIDDELGKVLARQGQALDTVPAAGQAVRLEGAPSVAGGGEVRPVFDIVHPDNAALAVRAARLLRLDIAGIDFISPDIARSWREGGGWITEVNSQPQISPLSRPEMFRALLSELVENEGRIPVALVLGDDGTIEAATSELLAEAGICAGLATDRQITIGTEAIAQGEFNPAQAASALTVDPSVAAIVMFADAGKMLQSGLPFDRVDVLVVADGMGDSDELRRFLSLAKPYLRGAVLAVSRGPAVGDISAFIGERSLRLIDAQADLAKALCRMIDERTRGRRQD